MVVTAMWCFVVSGEVYRGEGEMKRKIFFLFFFFGLQRERREICEELCVSSVMSG